MLMARLAKDSGMFGKFAAKFLRNERGTIALLFGLLIVPLMMVAGIAIDYGMASTKRTAMQSALDAATLAAALEYEKTGGDGDWEARGVDYYTAQLPDAGTPQFSEVSGVISGEVTANVRNAFGGLLNAEATPVGARSQATAKGGIGLELALVLDVSGSMKGGGKIESLRSASVALIDKIYGDHETLPDTWVTVVPFSGRVNIYGHDAWIDAAAPVGGGGTGGTDGKKEKKEKKGEETVSGGSATVTAAGTLCTGLRPIPAEWDDSTPSQAMFPPFTGPADVCPGPKLIPLNDQKTVVRNALLALYTGHGTSTQIGMAWGYRVLSPKWRGLWGNGSLPLDYGAPARKIAIIMTDGQNHPDQSGDPISEATANERLLDTCRAMKDEGIIVYAVTFQMSDLIPLYQTCATTPQHQFDATNNAALLSAFDAIGNSILAGDLRLIR